MSTKTQFESQKVCVSATECSGSWNQ